MTNAAPTFDPKTITVEETDETITRTRDSHKYDGNPYIQHINRSHETKKALKVTVPGVQVADLVQWLRNAAQQAGKGLRLDMPKGPHKADKPVTVKFQATDKRKRAERKPTVKVECPECHEQASLTGDGKLRVHGPQKDRCKGSQTAYTAPSTAPEAPAAEAPPDAAAAAPAA